LPCTTAIYFRSIVAICCRAASTFCSVEFQVVFAWWICAFTSLVYDRNVIPNTSRPRLEGSSGRSRLLDTFLYAWWMSPVQILLHWFWFSISLPIPGCRKGFLVNTGMLLFGFYEPPGELCRPHKLQLYPRRVEDLRCTEHQSQHAILWNSRIDIL